jgi:hypothetical protein
MNSRTHELSAACIARRDLDLSCFNAVWHGKALKAFSEGDAVGLLCLASNAHSVDIVAANVWPLIARGIYEETLLHALTNPRTNNAKHSMLSLRRLLSYADRARLRAAGDPIPGHGPFTLYRGVAGVGSYRRERGLSWTSDREIARWFAVRYSEYLANPAIVTATFREDQILAFVNDRKESEFAVWPGTGSRMTAQPVLGGQADHP